jgi:hypothetical protein
VTRLAVLALCAGCAARPPATKPTTYASHVVTLSAGTPAAIVTGAFAVTAINPGSDLELSLVRGACRDDAVWFTYSGGGVSVGAGETLCARTDKPRAHAFSGHD